MVVLGSSQDRRVIHLFNAFTICHITKKPRAGLETRPIDYIQSALYYTKTPCQPLIVIRLHLLGTDASPHLPYQPLMEIGICDAGKGLKRTLQGLHFPSQGRYSLLVG